MVKQAPLKILILGGTGFIGKNLVARLDYHDITILSRSSKNGFGYKHIQHDRSEDKLKNNKDLGRQDFDVVIDISGVRVDQVEDSSLYFDRPGLKYIFISSVAVYDQADGQAPDETSPFGKAGHWGDYSQRKIDCEEILTHCRHLSACILRPSYIFGENNSISREKFIFSRLWHDHPICLPSDQECYIQFTDVKLLTAVIDQLIDDRWHEGPINIANKQKLSFRDWVEMLGLISGKVPRIIPVSGHENPLTFFPFKPFDVLLNTELMQRKFSIDDHQDLYAGFERCLSHLREHDTLDVEQSKVEQVLICQD